MKALVTGASSGIGRDIAKYLSTLGYDIIAVARDGEALNKLKEEIKTKVDIYSIDLADEEACVELYKALKNKKVDVLVNNAGFGDFGEFVETDLDKELNMINVNIKAVHILTKLFLQDMVKRNSGYILNVASIAGFMPGPLMATYYSTKAYIVRLTQGINTELKKKKSKVKICALCPGPVNTNFNKVANVKFGLKGLSSEYVAKYAVNNMFKGKLIILPGVKIKLVRFLSKIAPDKLVAKICMTMQKKKQ
jgi:hypothetical protein